MDTIKQKESDALGVYHLYWDSYMNGDLENFASTLDEEFEMIGTSESEVAHNKADGIAFYKAQMEELVGKAEMRNRNISVKPLNGLFLFNEDCDIYVLGEPDWTFYSKIRISTLLRETGSGWKLIQQHGSFPDMRVQEGETLAIDKITKENLELRDAVKRHTADLENKNRALEIEAALERIRARAMAMRHTGELSDVLVVLFQQYDLLEIKPVSAILNLMDLESGTFTHFTTGRRGARVIARQTVDFTASDLWQTAISEWEKNEPLSITCLRFPQESLDGIFDLFPEVRSTLTAEEHIQPEDFPDGMFQTVANCQFGNIGFMHNREATEQEKDLVVKFAREFEQFYQRFLDLKKAEEQAREAEIQLSLERIRARSMAMRHTGELSDVLVVLFQQYDLLEIKPVAAMLNLFDLENETFTHFTTGKGGSRVIASQTVDLTASDLWQKAQADWEKNNSQSITCIHFPQESLKELFDLFPEIRNTLTTKEMYQPEDFQNGMFQTVANCQFGNIGFQHTREATEEEKDVLVKFTREFEQFYQRFLDLQKAEAQAREAQIEVALERVRSRSMAMHKSEDLRSVVNTLYGELQSLNVDFHVVAIRLIRDESMDLHLWLSTADGLYDDIIYWPYTDIPIFHEIYNARATGKMLEYTLSETETKEFFEEYFKVDGVPQERKAATKDVKVIDFAGTDQKFTGIFLMRYTDGAYSSYEKDIVRRFSKAFEQTYTRFLDLQKAEAQTREAQIEASMERVRAAAMAMHQSDELPDMLSVLFDQFDILGINPSFTHLTLFDEMNETFSYRMSGRAGHRVLVEQVYDINMLEAWKTAYRHWKEGDPNTINCIEYPPESLPMMFDIIEPITSAMPEESRIRMEDFPNGLQAVQGHCKFGYLGFHHSRNATEEEKNIVVRFAGEFGRVYQRFLDLKKAEAQARQARIEMSLEKVRSKAMAMQHSDDLDEMLAVFFEQFDLLGINPSSTHMSVFDIENNTFTFRETGKYGNRSFGQQTLKLDAMDIWKDTVDNWKANKPSEVQQLYVPKETLPKLWEIFDETFASMPEEARSTPDDFPDGLYHTSGKHPFGYIGMNQTRKATEEEAQIIIKFANEFGRAYQRFLDLQKAEAQAREAQIQLALERVRAKTMAMKAQYDLLEVIESFGDQLISLGLSIDVASIINGVSKKDWDLWHYIPDFEYPPLRMLIPYKEIPYFTKTVKNIENYERSGNLIQVKSFTKEEKDEFFFHYLKYAPPVSDELQALVLATPGSTIVDAFLDEVTVSILKYELEPYSDEHIEIFKRFSNEFRQAYIRFLDLQKAEAQAYESQIEASLERVRAKAMNMSASEDLTQIAEAIFTELDQLDFKPLRFGLGLIDGETESGEIWTSTVSEGSQMQVTGSVPLNWHPMLADAVKAWRQQAPPFRYTLEGSELYDYYGGMSKTNYKLPGKQKDTNVHIEGPQYWVFISFPAGGMFIFTLEPLTDQEISVIERYSDVFQLAYTRFEDLMKAEERTRAALRESSLDRVRAQIAAMRSKEDLNQITPLVWNELTSLGIPFIRCGVFIVHEETEQVDVYLSKPDGTSLAVMHLPFGSSGLATQTVKAWKDSSVYTQHWTKEEFLNWGRSMMEQGQVADLDTYQGAEEAPESLNLHFIPFKQGMLYVGSIEPLKDDEIGLGTSLADAFSIAYARYEDFVKLEKAKAGIEDALAELKATQSQLVQQEKLASLGQLTAGIAHEIKNPLNFVNNFSEVSLELVEEMRDEVRRGTGSGRRETEDRGPGDSPLSRGEGIADGNARGVSGEAQDSDLILEILDDIEANLRKIHEHGSRADSIVKSMLQHSRGGDGKMEPTLLNPLIKEYVNLAFHGMRAGKEAINVDIDLQLDESVGEVPMIAEDFSRVILNLCNNAFDACAERSRSAMRSKLTGDGGPGTGGEMTEDGGRRTAASYLPKLSIRTKLENGQILIEVQDNGPGIPDEIKDKILQPFFTTKKGTQGTGLGLSITNDIVKAHGGDLSIDSKLEFGTTFKILL